MIAENYTIVDHMKTNLTHITRFEKHKEFIPLSILKVADIAGEDYDKTEAMRWQLVKLYLQEHPEIPTKSRIQSLVMQRQYLMAYLNRTTKFSLAKIGNLLGGKDHSTVLHSTRAHDNYEETDDFLYKRETHILRIIFKIKEL